MGDELGRPFQTCAIKSGRVCVFLCETRGELPSLFDCTEHTDPSALASPKPLAVLQRSVRAVFGRSVGDAYLSAPAEGTPLSNTLFKVGWHLPYVPDRLRTALVGARRSPTKLVREAHRGFFCRGSLWELVGDASLTPVFGKPHSFVSFAGVP